MVYLKVTYKVKPDKIAVARQAIEEFVAGIKAAEPNTFYEAYQHPKEPVRFTHFMAFPDITAQEYHQHALHTEQFVAVLYPNCEELPVFTKLERLATTK
jgi:quinol monooxygenase YgiN